MRIDDRQIVRRSAFLCRQKIKLKRNSSGMGLLKESTVGPDLQKIILMTREIALRIIGEKNDTK